MKAIKGPGDTAVGAHVRYTPRDRASATGIVCKVSPTGLTIRTSDGRRVTAKYLRKPERHAWFDRPVEHSNFMALSAHEIWWESRPRAALSLVRLGHRDITIDRAALANPEELFHRLREIKDWYDAEPSEAGEP